MKVACLLSGQPRFCKSFDAQLQHLKNDDTIDWFVCIWKNNQLPPDKILIPPALLNTDTTSATEYVQSRMPAGHRLVKLSAVDELDTSHIVESTYGRWGWPYPTHIYLMYQGVYLANQLKIQHEEQFGKYDLVIRTRPDLSLNQDLDLLRCKQILDQHDNAILTPKNGRWGNGSNEFDVAGTNDQFAIGSSKTIDSYAEVGNNLKSIYDSGIVFSPENLLRAHFQRAQIKDLIGDFEARLREHFYIVDNTYITDFGTWV